MFHLGAATAASDARLLQRCINPTHHVRAFREPHFMIVVCVLALCRKRSGNVVFAFLLKALKQKQYIQSRNVGAFFRYIWKIEIGCGARQVQSFNIKSHQPLSPPYIYIYLYLSYFPTFLSYTTVFPFVYKPFPLSEPLSELHFSPPTFRQPNLQTKRSKPMSKKKQTQPVKDPRQIDLEDWLKQHDTKGSKK